MLAGGPGIQKSRFTITADLRENPCATDKPDDDGDVDVPPCSYGTDDYLFGLGVATKKGLKVARALITAPGKLSGRPS